MSEESCCPPQSTCCSLDAAGGSTLRAPGAEAPAVSTSLTFADRFGACRVRLGIGRNNYKLEPGLYRVGSPNDDSPVLVSANYKLTFDTLRKNLQGLDCWLLILDTKGINVWCAAGKGTFGTAELLLRIEQAGLARLVSHRQLVLPQLGAPGVDSNEVARQSGFRVVYGPVRASDIKQFIASGFKASPEMRRVKFTLRDRLVLTPIELGSVLKISLIAFGVLFLINLFAARPFGLFDIALYLGAVLTGAVLTPLLLPLIPGRAFAWKGWLLGLIYTAGALWIIGWLTQESWFTPESWLLAAGYLLLLPACSSYLAMNFTGASTYTSPSGVLKEMRLALPLIIGSAAVGAVLLLVKTFIG